MEVGGPLIVLCWNNCSFGEIKSSMLRRDVAPVGVDLHTPDFVTIAKSYGLNTKKLESPEDLPKLLRNAVESKAPTLIEIDESRNSQC
jgi:acetolactate synthase-1/2/3 large subunit